MIIRCPECSTGFRLSDDRVRGEPIKVRCTNCEHIFKAGLVEGKPTLYDTSGEPLPDEKQLAERDDEKEGGAEAGPPDEQAPPGQASEQGGGPPSEASGPGEGPKEAEDGEDAPAEQEPPGAQDILDESETPDPAPADEAPAEEDAADEGSGYNPFPHAGSEAQPKKPGAISGDEDGGETSAGGSETSAPDEPASDEDLNSFSDTADLDGGPRPEPADESEGAVSVHPEHSGEPPEFEGEETAVGKPKHAEEEPGAAPESNGAPPAGHSDGGLDETVPPESVPGASPAPDSGDANQASDAAAPEEDLPQDDDSIRARQKDRESDSEPAPQDEPQPDKPASETEAPSEAATDEAPAGEQQADEAPAGEQQDEESGGAPSSPQPPASASGPPGPAGVRADAPGPSGDSTPPGPTDDTTASDIDDSPSQSGGADFEASNPGLAEPSSPPGAGGGLALDEVDRVDSQSFGSGGMVQTVANVLLALLVGAAAFVTLAASQNNWLFDFQELDQMASVAFAGAEYEARDELIREVPKPVEPPEPENPIEFEDVFVLPVTLEEASSSDDSKPEVLVLKGRAENVSDGEQLGVKVRGIVYDESGKVITQASAPLGADLPAGQIAGAGSVEEATGLITSDPVNLPAEESRPFTIIFDSVPSPVKEGMNVDYRVEVAKSYSPGESE